MASYRNFPNEEDPQSLINENSSGQPADRTRNLFEDDVLETSSRGQDFLLKTGNYVGNEEINGSRTLQGGQNNNFGIFVNCISWFQNELSAMLRFGAEELFKDDNNEEESKKRLLSLDIDEILERAEKVEEKETEDEQGHELLGAFKQNCSTEDDGSFWSRWIKPEAAVDAEEALAPRAARNTKSYVGNNQSDSLTKRKKTGSEPQGKAQKCQRLDNVATQVTSFTGAVAQVREWSYGNLSKRDATRFHRAVTKFGIPSQISLIAAEIGGIIENAPYDAQIELYDALVDGCKEAVEEKILDPKGPLLDFFGVPVRANDLLARAEELLHLEKRVNRYEDPIRQFRVLTHLKPSTWSKGCGWSQIDDATMQGCSWGFTTTVLVTGKRLGWMTGLGSLKRLLQ